MRTAWLILLAACLAIDLTGATVGFQVSDLGGGTFRYTYSISSFPACPCMGDALDLSFDPTVYKSLQAGQAEPSSDWSLLLFTPNTPPGAFGDYLATALVNSPSFAGPFTVEFTLQAGAHPGPQPFTIFDPNFTAITSGETIGITPPIPGLPEPSSLSLVVAGLLIGGVAGYARRRAHNRS